MLERGSRQERSVDMLQITVAAEESGPVVKLSGETVDAWILGSLPGHGGPEDPRWGPGMALNQAFDADTLADLRKAVLAEAVAAGMTDDRATKVVLAVHELAANAVRHGAGAGRARMRVMAGELYCQVSDAGRRSPDGDARRGGASDARSWPVQPGHGLWLVQNSADRVRVASSLGGFEVTVVFALPGFRGGAAGH